MTDVAIAHKDYDVRGGGEVLAEQLARTFDAPLFVGRAVDAHQPDDFDLPIREIDLTRWQRWLVARGGAPRSLAYMIAWQTAHPDLTGYDVVVTSGNEPLWYVPTDDQAVVAYTHSTPRWQYDLFHERDNGLLRVGYNSAVRSLYLPNVHKPDVWVANSDLVARRMSLYWDVPRDEIAVVYPPVDVEAYAPDSSPTGEYYLYLGRLSGTKRVGDVLDAFRNHDAPLVVAGDGPDRDRLEATAPDNVSFGGFVSEQRKRELYAGAKALIYPAANEDFGMVPVEAMAAGTPVLGVKEGFTQYQIQGGKNGYTYDREGDGLAGALATFEREGVAWDADEIAGFADQFNTARFEREMRAIVDDASELVDVDPDLETPADPPAVEL